MEKGTDSLAQIRKSLQKLESEVLRLQHVSKSIPAIQKNIGPITAFIDIIKLHLMEEDIK